MDKFTLWARRIFIVGYFILGYVTMMRGDYDRGAFWLTFANFILLLRISPSTHI